MKTSSMKLIPLALAAALVPVAPAVAQVYPERIPSAVRAQSAEARQQRNRQRAEREQGREEQVERTTRTIRLGANGELDASNISGDITITRAAGQDATIEIVKTARAQTAADAKEMLGLVTVDVAERAGRAEVRAQYPRGDGMPWGRRNANVSVAYNIAVPSGARVSAKSISGNITVRDIAGELTLESVSGNITTAGSGRVALAKSISGNVEITGANVEGSLDASSVSGTVALRKTSARRLSLSAVSGDLVLQDVACGRVDLQTVSGNVEMTGPLQASGRYDIHSHSGDIRLTLTGDTGFEVDATSFSGEIRSDFPLQGQDAGQADRRGRQRSLHGVYGNGSAVLDLNTFSGGIVIGKR
jgi:DUF4097 and DUF4098 domain-containing protein YvlB